VDGPICGDALRALGTRIYLSKNPGGLGNPQETFTTVNPTNGEGLLRDYTGQDCDVQDIVQPANLCERAVRESLMLDAKQRAAGSSPARDITSQIRIAPIWRL
jgi:hypothetical protein